MNTTRLRKLRSLLIFGVTFSVLCVVPMLSSATPATSVTIVNNSSGSIRHLYVSHVNADDWSGDQLNNSTIDAGQSVTISNIACDQQQMKLIGENQDGCFVSTEVSCGGSTTWTITNSTAADCGQ
ncbi:MAG TPA: hypothetical protein VGN90_14510 [Pyrinomonadaceae bacterium]|nr:hypothetical protein [Pyrinomonadaceae bacterium]